jgi:hypothetical protein
MAMRGYLPSITIIISLDVAMRTMALVLETWPKRSLMPDTDCKEEYGAEELTGIFGRMFFWWLNPLFWKGNRKLLSLGDLQPLDRQLLSPRLQKCILAIWDKSTAFLSSL